MPRFHLITFGCQMNQHDTDRIADVLSRAGHRPARGLEDAELVLLNTCSVREKAEQKLRSEVGRLGALKRSRPNLVIAVAGCVAQQEGERLVKKMPQIDILIGPDQAPSLPRLLQEVEHGGLPQVRTGFDLERPQFLTAPSGAPRRRVSDFVTTMKGCDERCTFCIVPTTRGPERYRPSEDILAEIADRVAAGTREITLLGQTVDSYRDPGGRLPRQVPTAGDFSAHTARARKGDESEFPALLRAIAAAAPGLARLRYTSPHPRHLTPGLVAAHRDLPVLARHVHMPVQSGSDRVLKRMLRRYSVEEYVERIEALRRAAAGLTVSTDIIVGFPGETEADFEATLELARTVGFQGIFGFKYSPRPHTAALKLGDPVEEEEKSRRLAELFRLSDELQARHLEGLVGSRQHVLVEGMGERGGYTGRTERNEIVHFEAASDVTGQIVAVEVREAYKHSLRASPTSRELRLPEGALSPVPADRSQAPPPSASSPGRPLGLRSLRVVP